MRGLKVLITLGFPAVLMVWITVPAEETQEAQPIQKIEITCERNYITVKPTSFQLSQFSNEKVKWHFVGSGPKSVGACIVGDSPLSKSLKKIEISLNIPTWASSKYPKLLSLTYPTEPWQDGVDYEIEGTIGDKQLEEDEIRIEYSIRFLSGNGELLLERKGFEMKLIPAIECAVHPGPAKNKDGDYNTITQALNDTARQCEKVVVEPGAYEDNPTIEPRLRRLVIEASGEERKPIIKAQQGREMNQIFFLKKASNVTIEGLNITGGNVGILIQRSQNIVIRNVRTFNNEEAGIRVTQSGERGAITLEGIEAYENGKAANRERKGGLVIISSNVTIDNSFVHDNEVSGVSIIDVQQKVTISSTTIKSNKGDGVFIKDASVDLTKNVIFQNAGYGVRVDGGFDVQDSSGRSNMIIANGPDPINNYPDKTNKYNTNLPPVFARKLRKPEIIVPDHVKTIQQAVYEAEPASEVGDQPYKIIINPSEMAYQENLCLDRSLTIEISLGQVTLQPADPEKPTISIASTNCPLLEERSDPRQLVQIQIQPHGFEGGIVLNGTPKAQVGFQIGTLHKDLARKTSLEVKLQNVTVQNYTEAGIKVSAENNKEHSLFVSLLSNIPLKSAACSDVPSAPSSPISNLTLIRNNKVGIQVEIPQEALVQLQIENALIRDNSDAGLKLISRRTANPTGFWDLKINSSWIVNNTSIGLILESEKTDKPVIKVRDTRLWENKQGGILLKAADSSQLTAELINIDVRKNKEFGIEIAGAVDAVLKADVDIPESNPTQIAHSCWITENFGTGIYIHGPTAGSKRANVTVEKLFVFGNGFEDKRGGTPKLRKEKDLAGPDGIFATGLVNLTVRNNLIGLYTTAPGIIESWKTGNAGVGILLHDIGLANQQRSTLTAEIIGNHIKTNRKWGVAYISQGCLDDIPVRYRIDDAQVTGSANEIRENGEKLSFEELKYGHKGQVCPNISKLRALDELLKQP